MEFMTKPQERELNKIAKYTANDNAKEKGFFPKRRFKPKDLRIMYKNRKRISPTIKSLLSTAKVIRGYEQDKEYRRKITQEEFEAIDLFIKNDLEMDSWGLAIFDEVEIYKGMGIPYNCVIVMTRHMDKDKFKVKELPNMNCMIEVMKVYGDTGVAALELSKFLRNKNFGAVPNHSLGGNIDYTKAAFKANLGFVGQSGLLITPENGSCNRISIVYTSIENLGDFLQNNKDHRWGNDFCNNCKTCVKLCPHGAIYEESKVINSVHIECISNEKCAKGFAKYGCGVCVGCCPFTMLGYDRVREKFELI